MKLTKTQQQLKQRVDIAGDIYERLYREYLQMSERERWKYNLTAHVSAEIQATLVVSERKAKEYLKLAKVLRRPLIVQQKT